MLNERIHLRVSKWEKDLIKTHKINPSRLFRSALQAKIRELTQQEYLDKDVYAYATAWNKICKEVGDLLTEEDLKLLSGSEDRKLDLQKMVAGQLSRPKSLEYFAVFLQGRHHSDHILASFFNFPEQKTILEAKNRANPKEKSS